MKQINIRVGDNEYQILELIAKMQGIPVTSLFRTIINESFSTWKITKLLELYSEGQISFKEIVSLSRWSYTALIKKFADFGLEPPMIDIVEKRAEEISIAINPSSILKNPRNEVLID